MHNQLGLGIPISWVSGIIVSLVGSAIWLRIHGSPILPRPNWAVLRALGKTTVAHNWLNLAIVVPATLIPVLVTVVVSPSANAAFYIAWMLAGFLYAILWALSIVLFAVASAEPHLIARKMRFALKVSLWIGIPCMLILCFGAHFILSLFGINYARAATFSLWLLSLCYVPMIPKTFYIAVCRASGRVLLGAIVLTIFAAIEITAAGVAGSIGGLKGLSIAILVVTVIEGLATTPAILNAITSRRGYRRGRRVALVGVLPLPALRSHSNRNPVCVRLPSVFCRRMGFAPGVVCRGCRRYGRICAGWRGYGSRMLGGLRAWRGD